MGNHYYYNGKPKDVYVYPLKKGAIEMLNLDYLPKYFEGINQEHLCLMNNFAVQGLIEAIRKITDPGKRQWIRHKTETILALSVYAVLCGKELFSDMGMDKRATETDT